VRRHSPSKRGAVDGVSTGGPAAARLNGARVLSLVPVVAVVGALAMLLPGLGAAPLLAALERNDWHVTRSAAELGLADHASLLKIMRRHGISRPAG